MKILLSVLVILIIISISIIIMLLRKMKKNKIKLDEIGSSKIEEKQLTVLADLLEIAFSKSDDIKQSSKQIIEILESHFNMDYCTLLLGKEKEKKIMYSTIIDKVEKEEILQYINETISVDCKDGKIQYNEDGYLLYPTATERKINYYYYVPLRINNEEIGSLFIENTNSNFNNELEKEFFKVVVNNITVVIQNLLIYNQLYHQANTDKLTGLYNRNYMNKYLEEQKDIVNTNNSNYHVCMMDIDHFKKVNDTYGHDKGDEVLRLVSSVLKNKLSGYGMAARYGGEEFLIFISDMNIASVYSLMNDIRVGVIDNSQDSIPVTISCGIATGNKDIPIQSIVKNADKALYYSKETGRNKITKFEEI